MSAFSQKVAIITGASRGIGAGLVEAYRKQGYAVVATSRTVELSQDEAVVTVQGDIAERATAERVITTALEKFGRVDTLVNNAGVFIAKPFTEYTIEDYEFVTGINLTGFFHITQLAISHMLERGAGGHIVQITTSLVDHADSAIPSILASITKGGLQAATKGLAIEYAGRGIRVNSVALGGIKTPLHPEEAHSALAAMHPLGRIGEVSDVADGVMYLEGNSFVTGEVLHVDGGQSAGR